MRRPASVYGHVHWVIERCGAGANTVGGPSLSRVVTTTRGEILRIRLFSVSATYTAPAAQRTAPAASTAKP